MATDLDSLARLLGNIESSVLTLSQSVNSIIKEQRSQSREFERRLLDHERDNIKSLEEITKTLSRVLDHMDVLEKFSSRLDELEDKLDKKIEADRYERGVELSAVRQNRKWIKVALGALGAIEGGHLVGPKVVAWLKSFL